MPMHLLLRLEAPLMAFGTVAVDRHRPVQAWPATSMLTGLLANALGWTQQQPDLHDALQARLRWAARIDRPGEPLNDFQTAQLSQSDKGWTTRGQVESRDGGADSYKSPHLRSRDYRADASVLVALRLDPADQAPTLEHLAHALDHPARPLFIGRKGCPPATRLCAGLVNADDALAALASQATVADGVDAASAALYCTEGAANDVQGWRVHQANDLRSFALDVHTGRQRVFEKPARAWL